MNTEKDRLGISQDILRWQNEQLIKGIVPDCPYQRGSDRQPAKVEYLTRQAGGDVIEYVRITGES